MVSEQNLIMGGRGWWWSVSKTSFLAGARVVVVSEQKLISAE